MTGLLKRLIPLHEARVRRAQRKLHEDTLAHEQALQHQLETAAAVLALQNAQNLQRQRGMQAQSSSVLAQAGLAYAAVLGEKAKGGAARAVLAEESSRSALEKARVSREEYLRRARANQVIGQASDEQLRQLAIAKAHQEELRLEDEFSSAWTARRAALSEGAP